MESINKSKAGQPERLEVCARTRHPLFLFLSLHPLRGPSPSPLPRPASSDHHRGPASSDRHTRPAAAIVPAPVQLRALHPTLDTLYSRPATMPYSTPSSPDPQSPVQTRPSMLTHRRTRSNNFSDERGPGAFVSLGVLPRSHRRAVFHINVPDDDNNDESPHDSPPNSLRLSLSPARSVPATAPVRIELPPLSTDSVPFPTSSPLSPPSGESPFVPPSTRTTSQPTASPLLRTPSTPIILSNGKPLKSSLKSSSSSPNIVESSPAPSPPVRVHHPHTKHLRAQSAPSTPNAHKNVHFPESNLETVRLFSRSGKPASLSKPPGEETETETEAESSSYPFPLLPVPTSIIHEINPDPQHTSPIPNPSPSPYANVHLESLALPRTRPPTLRGTVLVRNMSFGKSVAVRFTLDGWQTTSEVACKHVVSLPGLPPPFSRPRTVGDVVGAIANGEREGDGCLQWDRFSFTIRLEDYEPKLAERALFLVVRYNPECGGEYWDNNDQRNYRVAFRRATPSPMGSPKGPSVTLGLGGLVDTDEGIGSPSVHSQQRTFSAPSTLRTTPTTLAALAQVAANAAANASPSVTITPSTPPTPPELNLATPTKGAPPQAPTLMRSLSSPFPKSPPPPRMQSPSVVSSPDGVGPQMVHSAEWRAGTNTAFERLTRRLSLVNYAAPTISTAQTTKHEEGMVTPPTTPPSAADVTLPGTSDEQHGKGEVDVNDSGIFTTRSRKVASLAAPASSSSIVGGMPATMLRTSSPSSGSPAAGSPPIPTSASKSTSMPVSTSPPGSSRFGVDFAFPAAHTYGTLTQTGRPQLLSPPRSLENSPSGTPRPRSPTRAHDQLTLSPLSDTSSSTAYSTATSPTSGSFTPPEQAGTPTPLKLDLAHLSAGVAPGSQPGSPRVDPSDSSYAAFVRQWCFAQSTPPPPPAGGKVERMVTVPTQGRGNYGFPGFNFGMPDAGMVGGCEWRKRDHDSDSQPGSVWNIHFDTDVWEAVNLVEVRAQPILGVGTAKAGPARREEWHPAIAGGARRKRVPPPPGDGPSISECVGQACFLGARPSTRRLI
ncbi:hypothetical protein OBBRIDRAFT_883654 [Obba rivulosa]|uniref:CBM21 domain-containing protein n=1 Tax=Obba rivulosa TaxID=1052685 RepID=A0A8E2DTR7_9APHY|nr:hypothetical protein OBBRIDRAFT_883654 [Obba rivulosa]